MKKWLSPILVTPLFLLLACKDDVASVYEYHAHIFKPDDAVKHMGDILPIDVEFESHTGQTLQNINVRIFNASTLAEVYNQPANSHVEVSGGHMDFQDEILLSPANGFSVGDWILQAKVWALEDGDEEEVEIVQFHIDN